MTRDAPETRGWKGDGEGSSSAGEKAVYPGWGVGGVDERPPVARGEDGAPPELAQEGVPSALGGVPRGKWGPGRRARGKYVEDGMGRRAGNLEPKM